MHATSIVQQLFEGRLTVHASRHVAVMFGVTAVLRSGRLSLTALARGAQSTTSTKHTIKRIDRLLGNERLHDELEEYYECFAHWLLRHTDEPLILIDWTDLSDANQQALRASVPIGGRAVSLYSEVHPKTKVNSAKAHSDFLKVLARILPGHVRPIIVTDAGFKTSWFKAVKALDWNYVGRVRGNAKVLVGDDWLPAVESLGGDASARPRDLGFLTFTKQDPLLHRCIVMKKKRKGRKGRRSKIDGCRIDNAREQKYRKQQREPWVLITSLTGHSAQRIANVYARRMQIEETFRDEKNHRQGWSLRHARSESSKRLAVLLLLGALASLVVTTLGMLTEQRGEHRHYQANTVRNRRVLSWFMLGCNVLRRGGDEAFDRPDLWLAFHGFHAAIATETP